MALAHPPAAFSMRPSNKETEISWHGGYDEVFDEYVEASPFDFGADSMGAGDGLGLFGRPPSSRRDLALASPSPRSTELSSFTQACKSPFSYQFEDSGFSRPNSPQSTASTPPPLPSITRKLNSTASTLASAEPRSSSVGIKKAYRKLNTTPNLSVTPQMAQSMTSPCAPHDIWAQRLQATAEKYNIPYLYQAGPLSPPPSVKMNQWDDSNFTSSHFDTPNSLHRAFSNQNLASSVNPSIHQMATQFTPLASPIQDAHANGGSYLHATSTMGTPYFTDPFSSDMMSNYASPTPDNEMSCMSSDPMGFSFSPSPRFQTDTVQPWWASTSTPQACDNSNCHNSRRMSHTISSPHGGDSYFSGTTVMDDSTAGHGLGIAGTSPSSLTTPYSKPEHVMSNTSPLYERKSYNSLKLPVTPRRQVSSESIDNLPSPGSRSRRASRSHRRNKSTITPSPKASVGFVNFTPDEADQILTGVAPSGSSKTKARREKEAAEKRRRLSQIAVRVVRDAGGDISALEKEGLLD